MMIPHGMKIPFPKRIPRLMMILRGMKIPQLTISQLMRIPLSLKMAHSTDVPLMMRIPLA